jgi:hypothetical protein
MSWKAVLIAASIAPLAGCRLYENAARNIINEPIEYVDEIKISHEARRSAERVWAELCAANPERTFTKDYANGFKDGYADYLDNGGPGVPPALPPRYYRRSHYLNPEGHALIRDWFSGFQQGIDIAKETGNRGWLTVPVLLPEPAKNPVLDVKQIPSEECAPGRDPRKPNVDKLPKPRPADPMTGLPAPERPTEPKSVPLPAPTPVIPPPLPAPAPAPAPVPTPTPAPAPNSVPLSAPAPNSVPLPMPKAEAAPTKISLPLPQRIAPAADSPPLTANESDTLGSGKYEISPVREGLRVIVRPVKDSR